VKFKATIETKTIEMATYKSEKMKRDVIEKAAAEKEEKERLEKVAKEKEEKKN
jgi:hypothetical protein